MRIHLDTDLGGDTDDACALAMWLGWAGVEITGITTVADPRGRRAGYVAHVCTSQVATRSLSIKVVLAVDGAAFRERWLSAVEVAAR